MDKVVLRDMLFQKYFQVDDGILISDFLDKLSFIPEVWKKLHHLCEKNIKHFDSFSSLEECKLLKHQDKNYLILKLEIWNYVIINLDKMENITKIEFENEFDEEFFIKHFKERKLDNKNSYFRLYQVERYEGNLQELLDFYIENKDVLELSSKLHYKLNLDNASTYLHIDFVNADVQLNFQTPDQFLYEQLFLKYDLTPSGMQDAIQKMGIEKMKEIFSKIKDIKIPIKCIPNDLYKQYLIRCDNDKLKKIKKKI